MNAKPPKFSQPLFSTMSHTLYDLFLYKFITGIFWRCPTQRLLDNYADHISRDHLEIGVGSGYFLDHTLCAEHSNRLTLLDLNRNCLKKSAKRLKELEPTIRHQSVFEPVCVDKTQRQNKFGSVAMNYVLHCISGDFRANRVIFENVYEVLVDGGVFFGATLLPNVKSGVAPTSKPRLLQTLHSKLLMGVLNRLQIFANQNHRSDDLTNTLRSVFKTVEVNIVGDAAIFVATK